MLTEANEANEARFLRDLNEQKDINDRQEKEHIRVVRELNVTYKANLAALTETMEQLRLQKDNEIQHLVAEAEKNRNFYELKINELNIQVRDF